LGRYDESLVHYDLAIEADPEDSLAHGGRASLLLRIGRVEESIAEARTSLGLSPDARVAHVLARALMTDRRLADSLEAYRSSLALDPTFAPAHAGMGLVLRDLERVEEAEAALRRSLALQPTSEALDALSEATWSRGAQGEALRLRAASLAFGGGEEASAALVEMLGQADADALRSVASELQSLARGGTTSVELQAAIAAALAHEPPR